MASSSTSNGWCRQFTNHPMFLVIQQRDELRRTSAAKSQTGTAQRNQSVEPTTEVKDLLCERNGEVYLWDNFNVCVLTTNLKAIACSDERLNRSTQSESDVAKRPPYQELTCSDAPVFQIDSISLNSVGTHLALSGRHGVTVLQLPEYRGTFGSFENGKSRILCRTTGIDERFFAVSGRYLLQSVWHPGSSLACHIALLTSDNVIRIYNFNSPDTPEQALSLSSFAYNPSISLDESNESFSQGLQLSPGGRAGIGVLSALGETAVSFDFGPPIEATSNFRYDKQSESSYINQLPASQRSNLIWPIYALMGNGEIYRLLTAIDYSFPVRCPLFGPLHMHPAAEDNYGSEACNVMCLHTQPPVIVIATCEGKLHHCVLLSRIGTADQTLNNTLPQKSLGGTSIAEQSFRSIPEPSLFVYETVELELSLTTVSVDTEELITENFSCPIKLHKDPVFLERYHCTHSAGLHSVVLPWTRTFQRFCESADDSLEIPMTNPKHQQSIVEHLLCTKPLLSSPPSPVLGVCWTTDRLLGHKVICLTSTLQCVIIPLMRLSSFLAAPLLSETSSSATTPGYERNKKKEPFDVHIQSILERTSSNPILCASNFTSDMTPQDCFQLLSRITQVFREEYIQKQDRAREEIERRVRVLCQQKDQLISDLNDFKITRKVVEAGAMRLTDKYKYTIEAQQNIVKRVEELLRKLQQQLPMLSDAEKTLQGELQEHEQSCQVYNQRLNKLKDKKSYQNRVMDKSLESSLSSTTHRSFSSSGLYSPHRSSSVASTASSFSQGLSGAEILRMKTALKEEGKEIQNIVRQITELQIQAPS